MKKHLAFSLFFLLFGCGQAPLMRTTAFSIEGMTCENCVSAITTNLENTPGVVSCAVSLRDHNAIVVHDARVLPPSALIELVNRMGFTATLKTE